jgi:SAM-dependent methyltransferase
VLRGEPEGEFGGRWTRPPVVVAGLLTLAVTGYLGFVIYQSGKDARLLVRNFYGALRVADTTAQDDEESIRRLTNGTIDHGEQYLDPRYQDRATTYYGPNTGVGLAIRQAQSAGPLRVGVIGLGAGTLAAYGRPGDYFQFYEINPLVLRLAYTQFTFLKNCKAQVEVVLGDARLSLEREPPQNFDLLAVDAFSSDSIPVHLLTREAFVLYFRHLKPNGVLAVHISNKHLDLQPVVKMAAEALHRDARLVNTEDADNEVFGATWVLLTSDRDFFSTPLIHKTAEALESRRVRLWTDDYSDLFTILK